MTAALKRQLMAEAWDSYARHTLPKEAPAIQKQQCRRAFYAGGQATIFKLIAAFAPEGDPTAEDLQLMEDLHRELNEFKDLVLRGRA